MIASTSVLSKGSRISLTKPITWRSNRLTRGILSIDVEPKQIYDPGRSMKESFWALDFDGVICDSCGESSLSAWKVMMPSPNKIDLFRVRQLRRSGQI